MSEHSPEKRILLAFALAILVLLGWSYYMRTVYPPPEPGAGPEEAQAPAEAEPQPEPVTARPAAPESAGPPLTIEAKQGTEERFVTVETDTATIVFSTRGAVVRSWRLKDFRDDSGEPVELAQGRTTRRGFPLSLVLKDPELERQLNSALFVVIPDVSHLRAPGELTFEWSDGQVLARKRFRFERGYLVGLQAEAFRDADPLDAAWAWRGGFGEHIGPANTSGGLEAQVFVRTEKEVLRQPAAQAGQESGWLWKSPSPFPNPAGFYGGIEDRYFTALFLPRRPPMTLTAWKEEWKPEGQDKAQPLGAVTVSANAGAEPIQLFVGPKEIGVLEQLQAPPLPDGRLPELAEELVDFGWFWWVAKPLFLSMKWMYESWLPNYGWVIVALTILINILLFPLRWKSMESSFKMQKVAPQVKVIQDRYKQYKFNDPRKQKMQEEIMALYRQHGVNPLGGCLPLLLQLPFFYGFYKVLSISIEMRHAPWVLWIRDLSQKDPYYVLPVTMAITMYLSMKMTPMTMTDPRQARIMQAMMLVFAFAFLQVSSGLVLYWLVSSGVGLVQQLWINRWRAKHDAAEKEAARESKKKKRKHAEEEEK